MWSVFGWIPCEVPDRLMYRIPMKDYYGTFEMIGSKRVCREV